MNSNLDHFIVGLKKQKEDALAYIIKMYLPLVKTITTKILFRLSPFDIEECINDVFLSVWKNAHQFQGDAADFKKWIGMIAKYKAIDRYRQYEKQREREHVDELLNHKTHTLLPEHSLLQQEEKTMLLFALSQLSEIDSEIFIMKYYLELSNSEIADYLNLSKAAVDNRLYRGKKVLAHNKRLKELMV